MEGPCRGLVHIWKRGGGWCAPKVAGVVCRHARPCKPPASSPSVSSGKEGGRGVAGWCAPPRGVESAATAAARHLTPPSFSCTRCLLLPGSIASALGVSSRPAHRPASPAVARTACHALQPCPPPPHTHTPAWGICSAQNACPACLASMHPCASGGKPQRAQHVPLHDTHPAGRTHGFPSMTPTSWEGWWRVMTTAIMSMEATVARARARPRAAPRKVRLCFCRERVPVVCRGLTVHGVWPGGGCVHARVVCGGADKGARFLKRLLRCAGSAGGGGHGRRWLHVRWLCVVQRAVHSAARAALVSVPFSATGRPSAAAHPAPTAPLLQGAARQRQVAARRRPASARLPRQRAA